MNRTIVSIISRFKKYAAFLILLPILTGALSLLVSNDGEEPSTKRNSYFAKTTINLGEFNDPQLNEPNNVKNLISSSSFIQEVINDHNLPVEVEDVQLNMTLENVLDELIIIYLTGNEEDTTLNTLEGIASRLMELSDDRYNEWTTIITETMTEISESDVIAEDAVDKSELLFSLREEQFSATNAEMVEPVALVNDSVNVVENTQSSPIKNAVFGVIIGIMLSLFLLLLPEVFKD